jgi:hypothetical protein
MAEFVCSKCGYVKDTRCKPKVCPECDAAGSFDKQEDIKPAKKPAAKKATAKKPAAKKPAAKKPAAKKAK